MMYYKENGMSISCVSKNLKKGVDKRGGVCYNKSCVERESTTQTILENDTENVQTVQETVRFGRVKRLLELS